MAQAEQRLLRGVTHGERCFLSTPNLNFLIACRKDSDFRNSVLKSDLSVADGMPLVWLSRLLGVPIPERVAGSDLFEHIANSCNELRVFFFGGTEGVAEMACQKLNSMPVPACCVGFESPGFGSIAELSSAATIAKINASGANFVVVALGAKKGQEWIEANRYSLDAPLISHLGAVVNFAAGTVIRAPRIFRRLGLEWLWRIKEEPTLWRRYLSDGIAAIKLILTRVLPLLWLRFSANRSEVDGDLAKVETRYDYDKLIIRLEGAWTAKNLGPLRGCFADKMPSQGDIDLEMHNVTYLDSAALGLLMLLYGHQKSQGYRMQIVSASVSIMRFIRYNEASFLCLDALVVAGRKRG